MPSMRRILSSEKKRCQILLQGMQTSRPPIGTTSVSSNVRALFQESDDCFTPVCWEGTAMEWRNIIGSPFCPLSSGPKHVLTTLARYGDAMGNDIFPSQREIAFRAGVTSKTVNKSLKRAEKEGWIIRYEQGSRRGYRRHTHELCIPAGVFDRTTHLKKQFWKPPYDYRIVIQNDEYILEERLKA